MKTFDLVFWQAHPGGPVPIVIKGQPFSSKTAAQKAARLHAKANDLRFIQVEEIPTTKSP